MVNLLKSQYSCVHNDEQLQENELMALTQTASGSFVLQRVLYVCPVVGSVYGTQLLMTDFVYLGYIINLLVVQFFPVVPGIQVQV